MNEYETRPLKELDEFSFYYETRPLKELDEFSFY
jgi:hypothetical protein